MKWPGRARGQAGTLAVCAVLSAQRPQLPLPHATSRPLAGGMSTRSGSEGCTTRAAPLSSECQCACHGLLEVFQSCADSGVQRWGACAMPMQGCRLRHSAPCDARSRLCIADNPALHASLPAVRHCRCGGPARIECAQGPRNQAYVLTGHACCLKSACETSGCTRLFGRTQHPGQEEGQHSLLV